MDSLLEHPYSAERGWPPQQGEQSPFGIQNSMIGLPVFTAFSQPTLPEYLAILLKAILANAALKDVVPQLVIGDFSKRKTNN